MKRQTNSQKMAQAAYTAIVDRTKQNDKKYKEKFTSFAREFPSLVHSCGLAQAVAFAFSKDKGKQHQTDYLQDLASVLSKSGQSNVTTPEQLLSTTRDALVMDYILVSRNALKAADWLKRYLDAIEEAKS